MRRQFYIAHLIDTAAALVVGASDAILATEQIWTPETPRADYDPAIHFTPAAVADDAAAFFDTDDHGVDLDKDDLEIAIFGPFTQGEPVALFSVSRDDDGYPTTDLLAMPVVPDAFTFEAQGDQTVIYAEADDTCTALVVVAFGEETLQDHQARVRVIVDAMNRAAAAGGEA